MKWWLKKKVQEFPIRGSLEPAAPEPNYVCENCGMLIKTGHKHTRKECNVYGENEHTPDHRAIKTILPSRNEPKIILPFYYEDEKK